MLELKNVSVVFNPGTVNEKEALSIDELKIGEGELVSIIGSNGAGKTTLFNVIAGSIIPTTGKVLLDGLDITRQKEHVRARKIGRLFQNPLLSTAPDMTVAENLCLAVKNSQWLTTITRKDREQFAELLSQLNMGLEERLDLPAGLLSGGQRQALALLMASASDPDLLLLDEHTAALDPASSETVMKLTRDIVGRHGLTCLMITHNMEEALTSQGRLLMMDRGRIILDLSEEEKKEYSISRILEEFRALSGNSFANDRILLR